MMNKKILFGFFALVMMLFFLACDNGVKYDHFDVIPNSEPTPENPIGTGDHDFAVGFTTASDPLPANFQFQGLTYSYAGATDTTGDGFEVTFTLTVDVPAELKGSESFPEGSQNVTVTVDPYETNEGDDNFPIMYFNGDNNLRKFTFTPSANTVELTARYRKSDIVQRGVLPLAFTFNEKVYKNTMPRKLLLSVFSNGSVYKSRHVVLQALTEQIDDPAVIVEDESDNFALTIQDKNLESTTKQDFNIPLVMNISGVHNDYPINVTAKDSENIAISNIAINGGVVTFDATHSGISKFQTSKGKEVSLTVDVANPEHKDKYEGLPFDIVINTEREHTLKYDIDGYANNFTVSKIDSANLNHDTGGYYTMVTIPSMNIADATAEDKVTYEIFRKDDSSADFKSLYTEAVHVNQKIDFKDYNAFVLTTPEQEYKIKITHDGCSNSSPCSSEIMKLGSRMLTEREILLAAMETIRGAFGEWYTRETSENGGVLTQKSQLGGVSGTYYLGVDRHCKNSENYRHYIRFDNYKNSLVTLNGTFMKNKGDAEKPAFSDGYDQSLHGIWVHNDTAVCGARVGYRGKCEDNLAWSSDVNFQDRRTDALTVTYNDVDSKIVFNNIDMTYTRDHNGVWSTNEIGNKPIWNSGSFDIGATTYDKDSGVPFGFFMDAATFRTAIVGDGYTQK